MKLGETPAGPSPARSVLRYSRQAKFCRAHGKPGYRTRRKALRAAEAQRSTGASLDVYPCQTYGLFHITSQVERTRADRAKAAA